MAASSANFARIIAWDNLLLAHARAGKGKRGRRSAASFEHQLADHLLELQHELATHRYQPSPYTHFIINEPKRRLISAAAFRDRVVHHAICNIIEPEFERRFIGDSYANRVGKGTHRAIDRCQRFAQRYAYALRLDIVQHFASVDHAILLKALNRVIRDDNILQLISIIIDSGDGVLAREYDMVLFAGDDLLAACRPRGLPIGNLTSQFWSNCYLHGLDLFVKRSLGCRAYLRYVDDFALFSNRKSELWAWKNALIDYLAKLRLTVHEQTAQVNPVGHGVPWLGFVIYPEFRRVKARKIRQSSRHLTQRYDAWRSGKISFAEFDASVQGWINYVRYADTWQLRERVLHPFTWGGEVYRE